MVRELSLEISGLLFVRDQVIEVEARSKHLRLHLSRSKSEDRGWTFTVKLKNVKVPFLNELIYF